jgi:hypothetical protein
MGFTHDDSASTTANSIIKAIILFFINIFLSALLCAQSPGQ